MGWDGMLFLPLRSLHEQDGDTTTVFSYLQWGLWEQEEHWNSSLWEPGNPQQRVPEADHEGELGVTTEGKVGEDCRQRDNPGEGVKQPSTLSFS
jgi:hypothetical protein